jgi:ribose transport system ATP-binding protein
MIRMMVGSELADPLATRVTSFGDEALGIRGISLRRADRPDDFLVRDVTFSVRRGEIVGLFGLMGAGRTEVLRTLFGLNPDTSIGQIRVGGKPVAMRSPRDAIAAGLALAPEDRKSEGLVLGMSVAENASLSCLRQAARWGLVRPAVERKLVSPYVERLAVKAATLHQLAGNLSGGNQQKVVLAKWLTTRPKVLLLDEPTRGIDIGAKQEIYAIIHELAASGLAVVMASSELPEVLSLADRVVVLCEGRLSGEFSRGEATPEDMMHAALPKSRSVARS